MSTILVPTDFTPLSTEAAVYALAFASHHGISTVLLYHAYQLPLAGDPMLPSVELMGLEALKSASDKGMKEFTSALFVPEGVALKTLTEYNVAEEGVAEWSRTHEVTLIIAGLEQGSEMEEWLLGSNVVTLSKSVSVPVLGLPPGTVFAPVTSMLLTCDYHSVKTNLPTDQLLRFLSVTGAQLLVLHIDEEYESLTREQELQRLELDHALPPGTDVIYHHLRHSGFSEAINEFAGAQDAQVIAIVPKKHGWLSGLFRKHHSRDLAFHTERPLLLMHK